MKADPPITCPDLFGRLGTYQADLVRFRPAAYGILQHDHAILLAQSRFTGLWDFPGGGVEPHELLCDGMSREFREETRLQVVGEELIHVAEAYIAMFGRPYHSLRFYYRCRLELSDIADAQADPKELKDLRWWCLDELPQQEMHPTDWTALTRFLNASNA